MIRIRIQRRLHPDDFVLLFACVNLIASHSILYYSLSDIYWGEDMALNTGPTINALGLTSEQVLDKTVFLRRILATYTTLNWTCIYAIKLCFLLFFHPMIRRLKGLVFIWKIILGITLLFYCYILSSSFIVCPYFGHKARESPSLLEKF